MRAGLTLVAITLLLGASVPTWAQRSADVSSLLSEPAVRAALEAARAGEPSILTDQARLCEIAAPPFKEAARAQAYATAFRAAGLENVRIDREGNVLGDRSGANAGPRLVLSAHLDTVFPEDTDVRVTRDGAILRGPGISDDCRGLAVLLGVARALNAAGVKTRGSITFVGTVGEEGLGDLRGVKALFADTLKGRVGQFISVEGGGTDITHIGVGSLRYRVTYRGLGGHSYDNFGVANPIHAIGRALALIADLKVPAEPRTTFSVGRVGGGTSVNAIPSEAWMEIDLRSSSTVALEDLRARVHDAVERAVEEENLRWKGRGRLSMDVAKVGDRPAGQTPIDAPIVRTAVAVSKALALPAALLDGSTDSNVPMTQGVPAITIGGGGNGSGDHTTRETFDTTDSWRGTQRVLLLVIALTQ